MSRQLEQDMENRSRKRHMKIVEAVEFGLANAVGHSGAELTGLGVKMSNGDCMLVVKGVLAGKAQVAFVGAEDLGSALIKAVREGRQDRLRWREDKYVG